VTGYGLAAQRLGLELGSQPGGAALALILASRGVPTLLLERQHDFEREFRGEGMMPSGLSVLDAIGVDWRSLPHRQPERLRMYRNRTLVREVDFAAASVAEGPVTLSQPHLLERMVEQAAAVGHFELLRGAKVRELIEQRGRVTGVRARTHDEDLEIHARLVVGADGRASIVRRRGGFQARNRGAPMDVVWFKVPWPRCWETVQARGYLGGGHLLIALPAPDGMLQVAWVILKGTYGALRSRGVEAWARAMAEHVDADLAQHLLETVPSISRPFLLDSVTDRVIGWSQPGVLLIGDAAHTMSPVGGQGVNLALRDALVAANHLVPALREHVSQAELEAAARCIEVERAPEIDRIQRMAAIPPRIVMGHAFYHEPLRRLLMSLAATSLATRLTAPAIDRFLNGVTRVELAV